MLIQNCIRCVIFTLSHMHALSPLLSYNCLTFSIMEKNRPLTMLAKGTKVKQGRIFPSKLNIVHIICNKSIGFKTSEWMSKFCNEKLGMEPGNLYKAISMLTSIMCCLYLKQSTKFIQNKCSLDCVKFG